MNYLLHYNVSFSLMQFSWSKMNRKAREGPHSMLWEELLEARWGERKVIHRRSGAGASGGLLPKRRAPRTLAVPTGNWIQSSFCIIIQGSWRLPKGDWSETARASEATLANLCRARWGWGPKYAGLGPHDDVHLQALHFVNFKVHSSLGKERLHYTPESWRVGITL